MSSTMFFTTIILMTNGGPLMSTQKCEIPHLGECWYNPHSTTNIIALSDMTKKFRVTMDSLKEKALLVHFPNKVVKFKQMKGGLYAMNPKDPENFGSISSQSHLIQTLEQNLDYLSPRGKSTIRGNGHSHCRRFKGYDMNEPNSEQQGHD
jgi:hypothetical protein